jgi:hypothetical protein
VTRAPIQTFQILQAEIRIILLATYPSANNVNGKADGITFRIIGNPTGDVIKGIFRKSALFCYAAHRVEDIIIVCEPLGFSFKNNSAPSAVAPV